MFILDFRNLQKQYLNGQIKYRMLTNQKLESTEIQQKTVQETAKVHDMTLSTPDDPNNQTVMMKKLGKYQFSLDKKLGSGMAGDVYIGVNTQTAELVCVKVIDKQMFTTQQQKTMLQHQIKCQRLVECQQSIKINDVFDNNSFCFIVTEFCQGGDLYKLLHFSENGLPQQLVRRFGLNIAKALLKMKQMQIIHRDIKPENILLRHQTAKLGDFGFAIEQKQVVFYLRNLQIKQELNIGSPLYMSLEALEQSKYSYSSDIFSYGIVLYEMMHKVSPWQCSDQNQLKQKMRNQPVRFKEDLSEQVKDLIGKCLNKASENRITIQQVLAHHFFKPETHLQTNQYKTEQNL